MTSHRYPVWLGALLLCACGQAPAPAPEHEVMPVQETVIAPEVTALEKAKAVEQTLQQNQRDADATLRAAEQ